MNQKIENMYKINFAYELATYTVEHGITFEKLDDSCFRLPIVHCAVARNGRTNNEIKADVLKNKDIYISNLESTDIKIRYKIID